MILVAMVCVADETLSAMGGGPAEPRGLPLAEGYVDVMVWVDDDVICFLKVMQKILEDLE